MRYIYHITKLNYFRLLGVLLVFIASNGAAFGQGHPIFNNGNFFTITVCEGSGPIVLDSILEVLDTDITDVNNVLLNNSNSNPALCSVADPDIFFESNGGVISLPNSINLVPGATGTSILYFSVSSGYYSDTAIIFLRVHPRPVITIDGLPFLCENGWVLLTALGPEYTTYSWYHDGAFLATGNSITPDYAGPFDVVGTDTNGCVNSASHALPLEHAPIPYNLAGGGTYCAGGPGLPMQLSNSETGANYQLYTSGNIPMGAPVPGTGTLLDFGLQTSEGTYYVLGTWTANGCTRYMDFTPNITINPIPTAYNVSGGGNFCIGSGGVEITLAGSESTVNYQLYNGAVAVGSPVIGAGSGISFGVHTDAGTYSVQATNTLGCSAGMTGAVTVNPVPMPIAFDVTGGGNYCMGGPGVPIGLTSSEADVTYKIYMFSLVETSLPVTGTGMPLDMGMLLQQAEYTVRGERSGCVTVMNDTATVSVSPYLSVSGTAVIDPPHCAGDLTGTYTFTSATTSSIQYSLDGGSFIPFTLSPSTPLTLPGLAIGPHQLIFQDPIAGCGESTGPRDIPINAPIAITLAILNVTMPACAGGLCNGFIQIAGGTPHFTLTAEGSTSTPSLGAWTIALPAGTWPYTVADSFGCTFNDTFHITEPPYIDLTLTKNDVTCYGGNNGNVTLAATGGVPPYTYAKGTGSYSASAVFTGLTAGTYTFHLKDNTGCIHDTTITLTQPTPIIPGATATNVTCYAGNDGSVSLSTTGGTPPYTYARGLGAYSSSPDFTALFAGPNVYHTKDANNCIRDTTILTTQPPAINGITTATNVSCFAGSNGSFTVTASGGVPPYTYALGTGAYSTTSIFSGLSAGVHSLHIKDASNCQKDITVNITQPTIITPVKSISNVLCFGGNTGMVTLTATGGTPPYSYSWNGGPQNSLIVPETVYGLAAGTYTFAVQDSKGCNRDDNVIITEPTPVTLTVTPTNAACFGVSNGSVAITGSGGTPPYTYAKGTGFFGVNSSFTGLAVGTYTFHIRDSKSCTENSSATIAQPPLLVPGATATNVLCYGGNTGTISMSGSGGTPPYTFAKGSGPYLSTPTFGGLVASTTVMHVKDGNGCVRDTNITITQPTALTSSHTLGHVNCNGEAGGAIFVNASGGVPPYDYSLGGTSYTTSATFLALYAGTYQVYVRDANSCIRSAPATITQPARVQPFVVVTNVACNGTATGKVVITASGGMSPYTYANGSGAFSASGTFNSLAVGTYTFHIKDNANCTRDTTVTLTEPTIVVPDATVNDATCYALANGFVTLSATGGVLPYSYSKASGGYTTVPLFSGLAAGDYTFHIKDGKGCIKDTVLTVSQPTKISIAADVTHVNCNGGSNGSVTLTASGGTPAYTYASGSAAYTSSPIFANLAIQTATYHIKDANNCIKDTTITITQPSKLNIALSSTPTTCFYKDDGSANCVASGGVPPYRYQWTTGDTTASIVNVAKGAYFIAIKDANNCQSTGTAYVNGADSILLTGTINQPTCNGSCNGAILNIVSGGKTPITCAWNNGGKNYSIYNLCAGTYSVTITDAANCTVERTYEVANPPALSTDLGPDVRLCQLQTVKLTATIGKPVATYAWGGPAGFKAPDSAVVLSNAGTYWVKVTDTNGCFATDTINITKSLAEVYPEFVVASRIFKDSVVTLVNLTNPKPDSMVWLAPPSPLATVIHSDEAYRELRFSDTGAFVVGITAYKDGCKRTVTDTLVSVIGTLFNDPGTAIGPYIDSFSVAPNPSQGDFSVHIKLAQESGIRLRIISFNKYAVISDERRSGSNTYTIPYSAITIPGVYILMLESPLDHREIKLIIQ